MDHELEPKEEINAKKAKLGVDDARALVEQVNQIYSAKGKKVTHVDLRKEDLDDETLKKLMIGPTGNLRAPVLRKGKTLVVGFDQETYEKVFG